MRYMVSELYYNTVSALIGIALQDANPTEFELALGLINELITKEDQ